MELQKQESWRIRARKEAVAEQRGVPRSYGVRGADEVMVAVYRDIELPSVSWPRNDTDMFHRGHVLRHRLVL